MRKTRIRSALYSLVLIAFCFFVVIRAQEPPRFDSSTTIDIVSVPVTVTNRSGRFTFGLSRDDFDIIDDGVRRPLTQFSAERVPVSLCILLDISGSMATDPKGRAVDVARWADTRRALELLVSRLDGRDEILFAVFNDKVALASAWTQDHGRVLQAFDGVRPGGTTAMFDAVKSIAPAFQLAQHSRKVLLLISDGQDSRVPTVRGVNPVGYKLTEEQQIQAGNYGRQLSLRAAAVNATKDGLNTSGATLYAIGMGTRKGAYVNVANLEELTAGLGGYVEAIETPSHISAAVARVCDELQAQYLLAFEPAHTDGKYHTIAVKMKNRDMQVRARAGYVATRKTQ